MPETELSPNVKAAIEEVVQNELGRFGVREVEVREDQDHDGDPSITVVVHYRSADAHPEPRLMANAMFKVNDRLYEMKETRFAHMSHLVPEPPKRVRPR